MHKVNKMMCIGLLLGISTIPTSAFADSLTYSDSTSQNTTQSIISSFLTSLGCQVGGYTSTSGGEQVNFSDWWDKNKQEAPTQDSYQIWQQWYCGDFPGLGLGVGGTPSVMEGEGQFPGQGYGFGWQMWDAGH